MVGEDDKRVFGPTQVVPPVGQGFHHGKQLPFVDVVVSLGRSKRGRVVCDGVEFGFSLFVRRGVPFASFLGEDCSNPVCGSVSL